MSDVLARPRMSAVLDTFARFGGTLASSGHCIHPAEIRRLERDLHGLDLPRTLAEEPLRHEFSSYSLDAVSRQLLADDFHSAKHRGGCQLMEIKCPEYYYPHTRPIFSFLSAHYEELASICQVHPSMLLERGNGGNATEGDLADMPALEEVEATVDEDYASMHEIAPGLFHGDLASGAPENVRAHDIRNVINCASQDFRHSYGDALRVHTLELPWNDEILDALGQDIFAGEPNVVDAYHVIAGALLRGERVLVQCFQGKSRSSAVLLYYLIRTHQWSYDTALTYLRSKRAYAQPNASFEKQLRAYCAAEELDFQHDGTKYS